MLRQLEIRASGKALPTGRLRWGWRIGDLEEPAGFGLDAGDPVLEVVDGVREAVRDNEPEAVGHVDRGLQLPTGNRENPGGAGDGL
jgi:hypothetical protein